MVPIKVATINLRNRRDRWRERRTVLVSQLLDALPDVIALQEISMMIGQGWWLRNQLNARLAGLDDEEKRPFRLIQYRKRHLIKGAKEGVGILTRLPVVYHDCLPLGYGGRVAVRANLRLPSQETVDVVCVHLHNLPADKEARLEQTMEMVGWLNGRQRNPHQIIMGDFNEVPTGLAIQYIKQTYRSAYEDINGYEPVATYPTALIPPTNDWTGCLDYIFVSSLIQQVKKASIFCHKPALEDNTLYPSDHVGIIATVTV